MVRPRGFSRSKAGNPHADDLIQLVKVCEGAVGRLINDISTGKASASFKESGTALTNAKNRLEYIRHRLKVLASEIKNGDSSGQQNKSAHDGLKKLHEAIEDVRAAYNKRLDLVRKSRHSRSLRTEDLESADTTLLDHIDLAKDVLSGVSSQCTISSNIPGETYERDIRANEVDFRRFFASIKMTANIEIADTKVLWDKIPVNEMVQQYMADTAGDVGNGMMLYSETCCVTRTLKRFYAAYQDAFKGALAKRNAIIGADLLPEMGQIFLLLKYLEMTEFIDRFLAKKISDLPIGLDTAVEIFGEENRHKAKTFVAEQFRAYRRGEWDSDKFEIFNLNPGEPTPFTRIRDSQAEDIDTGGYCAVYFVQDVFNNRKYAIKTAICSPSHPDSATHVMDDFRHLSTLPKHRHLPQVHKLYIREGKISDMASEYGLVMQRADTSLQQLLNKYCCDRLTGRSAYSWVPKTLMACFGCLALCLQHIHKNSTRHRDIKPDNILVHCESNDKNDTIALLADFGRAHSYEGDLSQTQTLDRHFHNYSAPEVAKRSGADSEGTDSEETDSDSSNDLPVHNIKEDVFSLGLVFLTILSVLFEEYDFMDRSPGTLLSYLPFHAHLGSIHDWINGHENRLMEGQPASPLLPILRECRKMVSLKDTDRPTAAELVKILSQPSDSHNSNNNQSRSAFFCKECWHQLRGEPAPAEQQHRPISWRSAIRRSSHRVEPVC